MVVDHQEHQEHLQREGGYHERPGEYLGESLRDMDYEDGREKVDTRPQRRASMSDRPHFFLGSSGPAAPTGPKRKLKSSWLAGDAAPKEEEPLPIPAPTRKWKPPSNFKKMTTSNDSTISGTKKPVGAQKNEVLPEEKSAQFKEEEEASAKPGESSETTPSEAKSKLVSQSLPPSKFGPAGMKKGSQSVRNLTSAFSGGGNNKPAFNGSYSVRNLKHVEPPLEKKELPAHNETVTATSTAPISPVRLKHVENPAEGKKHIYPSEDHTTESSSPKSPVKEVNLKHVERPPEEKKPSVMETGKSLPAQGNNMDRSNKEQKPLENGKSRRTSLRKVGFPPEANDMDRSVKDDKPMSDESIQRRASLRKVGLPPEKGDMDSSAKEGKPMPDESLQRRASLRKVGLPPEKGDLDKSAKEEDKPMADESLQRRASLRKVGLPPGELDMSSSEQHQNQEASETNEMPKSSSNAVQLKHVEKPAEEKKPHGVAETSLTKRPSLRKVGLPDGELDHSAKKHQSMEDKSGKEHNLTNGIKAVAAAKPKKEEAKAVSPKTSKKAIKAKAPKKTVASAYAPTDEDFINCGNHDALLKKQEKEMKRLQEEKEELEKNIQKAKKNFTKLENKLNTLKMVLDQGLKKQGMKNIWA